jgi:lipoyl(octanoyl) transferase
MQQVVCRFFNACKYQDTLQQMQEFTKNRNSNTVDEIWFLEHNPVFTLGKAGLTKHILDSSHIPVIKSDRGGQVTYHAPGQLIVYFLIDLPRKSLSIKDLIKALQQTIVDFLAVNYQLNASIKPGAPGVYVNGEKICFIGLKVSRGCSYHGISLNINLDLSPFNQINPCGFENLKITQLSNLVALTDQSLPVVNIAKLLQEQFCNKLRYGNMKVVIEDNFYDRD